MQAASTAAFTLILALVLDAALLPAGRAAEPTPPARGTSLLARALAGPMKDAAEVVFAARTVHLVAHWYENFGHNAKGLPVPRNRHGRLCRLNVRTGKVTVLLDDPDGSVRDPSVHYDGRKMLFSYRRGGSECYNLYEVNADGTGLRAITRSEDFDDIEPAYTPAGDIVFISSRCKCYVPCWATQVAILYRCGPNGQDIRSISANMEHENTPAMLPDGRVLYTRWEYIDRHNLYYHHLWTVNPDGTGAMTFFGNMHGPGVFIDAKPIPGSREVVMVYSGGHGRSEHRGRIAVVDPKAGPDNPAAVRVFTKDGDYRDPYPLSADLFLVARDREILLLDRNGSMETVYSLPEGDDLLWVHEPQPLRPRPREPRVPERDAAGETTGRFLLADVTRGRNMAGVRPGEIRKLLVLEPLPKPVNFNGWPDTVSYFRSYFIQRILGTVPVEPDGSACFDAPAGRPLFFVALDEHDRAVKRMRSFATVMPGETVGCVGCHEPRTQTPGRVAGLPLALTKAPARISPLADVPPIIDFPRDVQPILDRHCVRCHNYDAPPPADLPLVGAEGLWFSHSYYALTRNGYASQPSLRAEGNDPPHAHGSYTAGLMKAIEPSHYDVRLTSREKAVIRLWIDCNSPYAGTYAALGTGMVPPLLNEEVLMRRCGDCHATSRYRPDPPLPPFVIPGPLQFKVSYGELFYQAFSSKLRPRPNYATAANWAWSLAQLPGLGDRAPGGERFYNLTEPERSPILLAPLSRAAGGWGACKGEGAVFADKLDPDYQRILGDIRTTKAALDEKKRFSMSGFRPGPHYVREMNRYGILPASFDPATDPIDVYEVDQRYWQSFWRVPRGGFSGPAGPGSSNP